MFFSVLLGITLKYLTTSLTLKTTFSVFLELKHIKSTNFTYLMMVGVVSLLSFKPLLGYIDTKASERCAVTLIYVFRKSLNH